MVSPQKRPVAGVARWLGRPVHQGEEGVALAVVVFGATQSGFQAREDAVLAGAEAMLDRYAAKLSIDPLYYQRFVDEAEAPRRCTDTSSPAFPSVVNPGNPWITDCSSWEYESTSALASEPHCGEHFRRDRSPGHPAPGCSDQSSYELRATSY